MEMASLVDRMIRASKLDASLYEEVEADKGSMGQAILVVVISGIAVGIAIINLGIGAFFVGIIGAIVGWFIWAALAYLIGAKLLPEPQTKTDFIEVLRTIGFSSSPGVLSVLGIIPGFIGPLIMFAVNVWMLAAMVIAIRQALDYQSTWRAVGVTVLGFIIFVIINILIRS